MSDVLKAGKKYRHVFAILRYETGSEQGVPIDLRVTVKKVVLDPDRADEEVRRLNELNGDKGAYYFCQVTRFEDAPVEAQALPPMPWASVQEPRA